MVDIENRFITEEYFPVNISPHMELIEGGQ